MNLDTLTVFSRAAEMVAARVASMDSSAAVDSVGRQAEHSGNEQVSWLVAE